MKRILLPFVIVAVGLIGCGAEDRPPPWTSPSSVTLPPGGELSMVDSSGVVSSEGLQERTSALTQQFSLGLSNSVYWTPPAGQSIQAAYRETQFPAAPTNPDSAFQFGDWWQSGNGGSGTITMSDGEGTGNLNLFATQTLWHVDNTIPIYAGYWVVNVVACTTNGSGHIYYRVITGWTFWPRDHMELSWSSNNVTIYSYDSNWNHTGTSSSVNLSFPSGPLVKYAYSPQVTFTMNTSGSYGGCMHDVPNSDQNLVTGNLGDFEERTLVGVVSNVAPSTPIYISTPLTNSKCSMHVIHEPDFNPSWNWDIVQWTVQGF